MFSPIEPDEVRRIDGKAQLNTDYVIDFCTCTDVGRTGVRRTFCEGEGGSQGRERGEIWKRCFSVLLGARVVANVVSGRGRWCEAVRKECWILATDRHQPGCYLRIKLLFTLLTPTSFKTRKDGGTAEAMSLLICTPGFSIRTERLLAPVEEVHQHCNACGQRTDLHCGEGVWERARWVAGGCAFWLQFLSLQRNIIRFACQLSLTCSCVGRCGCRSGRSCNE